VGDLIAFPDSFREAPEEGPPEIDATYVRRMRMRSAGVPARMIDSAWHQYQLDEIAMRAAHGDQKTDAFLRQLSGFRMWGGDPWLAFLFGPPGRGKTLLATMTVGRWVDTGRRDARFSPVCQILADMRAAISNGGTEHLIRNLEHAPLLVLDDLGAEMATEWARDILYTIVNHRYNQMLPTIVTSNMSAAEIASKHHDRMGSRLASGIVVNLSLLPDFRLGGAR
jgi:DNA replication protein DnaC